MHRCSPHPQECLERKMNKEGVPSDNPIYFFSKRCDDLAEFHPYKPETLGKTYSVCVCVCVLVGVGVGGGWYH